MLEKIIQKAMDAEKDIRMVRKVLSYLDNSRHVVVINGQKPMVLFDPHP